MSALIKSKKRPVLPDADDVEYYAKMTLEGAFNLTPAELSWHRRHGFLHDHGYILRPRYTPGWRPSWIDTNDDPLFCEDSVTLRYYQVIDAIRKSDNCLVAIKSFLKQGTELSIAQFLSSLQDPRNHCVPVYDILPDPYDSRIALMVMPFLRPCNNPEFSTIGDVVEFVDQTIEGLVFMHSHRVAHRDIAASNVMMDASSLYPSGYHPMQLGYTPDVLHPVTALPRAGRGVRYYYIDFGVSSRFQVGQSSLVLGDVGRAYVPELSATVPYDAFKVDIYALGDLLSKIIEQNFENTDFLLSLIVPMTQQRPDLRPTAEQVLHEWTRARSNFNESTLRWRLVPKGEPPLERVLNDTVAVAWEGVYRLRKLVTP
ncbi:kinase-like domain-containing protein [Trametes gibbosa]|nr:kinase-like domain-containing protein [Trametes gibbosa]